MAVKRYDFLEDGLFNVKSDGSFVSYEDYMKLEIERKSSQDMADHMKSGRDDNYRKLLASRAESLSQEEELRDLTFSHDKAKAIIDECRKFFHIGLVCREPKRESEAFLHSLCNEFLYGGTNEG